MIKLFEKRLKIAKLNMRIAGLKLLIAIFRKQKKVTK